MVSKAQGKYILLLNNDAVLHGDALKTLLYHAEGSDIPSILGLPQYDLSSKKLMDIGSLFDPFLNSVPNRNPTRNNVGMVSGACFWLPKILWDELGGFPDSFEYLAEDAYLCIKARLWGYRVNALSRSGFDHWVGKNLGGGKTYQGRLATTFSRRLHTESNKISIMAICYPSFLMLAVLPVHILLLTLEGILLMCLKRDTALLREIYLKAFSITWQRRYWLIEERKRTQQRRKIDMKGFCSVFTWYPYKLKMLLTHGLPSLS